MSTTQSQQTRKSNWRRRGAAGAAAGTLAAAALVTPAMVAAPATSAAAVSHWSGGGVTIKGDRWLKGRGVHVIRSRQCTELASRLYANRGWGYISNFYGMRANRKYGPLTFHRNGSGYVPRPGDVLVELGGSYQHVAVVQRVKGRSIITMEQNANANGVHIYRWNGRKASGAYGSRYVGGFIHSSRNPL